MFNMQVALELRIQKEFPFDSDDIMISTALLLYLMVVHPNAVAVNGGVQD
jgi:hypothetical protein